MCRLLVYFSQTEEILYDLTWDFDHSIIKQSYLPAYTPRLPKNSLNCDMNIDGFGLGWINSFDSQFNIYKQPIPVRNDINLKSILKSIKSKCLFFHLRANTLNICAPISTINAHPFVINDYMWMHNGKIANFNDIKKDIVTSIDNDIFSNIKGNTDSEYCFGVYLSLLKIFKPIQAFKKMIKIIDILNVESFLNIVVTNGDWLIASRICLNTKQKDPISLYYNKVLKIISSEPLTRDDKNWHLVPKNNILFVDKLNFKFSKVKF